MDASNYKLYVLFAQLGLPNSECDIEAFLELHSPLPDDVLLSHAPFWSPSQAQFLNQAIKEDADWALVVDGLSTLLRH